ncbi:unnamed protein product, partial [Ixodes pacificus]
WTLTGVSFFLFFSRSMAFAVLHPIQEGPQCLLDAACQARRAALSERCSHNKARHHEGVAVVDLMALESSGARNHAPQLQSVAGAEDGQAGAVLSARPGRQAEGLERVALDRDA